MQVGFLLSMILNFLAFALTVTGMIVMMKDAENDEFLAGNGLNALKYFTIQSNLLYGTYAGVFAVAELIYGSPEAMPDVWYLIKYVLTVGVVLTFLTVVCYLAPVVEGSYPPLFKGVNFFFHLLVPLLSMISFGFFERNASITLPQVFFGLIPFGLYAIFYSVNALSHVKDGQVAPEYDWYRFLAKGADKAVIPMIVMLVAVLAVCFGLWLISLIS